MKITVVIPVKNGEATIYDCLKSIYNQTIADQLEVIILDSASTDNTLEICRQFPVEIFHIKPQEFNHGLTRNYGALLAKGDLIYYTVQDARIAGPEMLARMVRYFDDAAVAGVVGMQAVPNHPDKNPAKWFKRFSEPKVEIRHFPSGTFTKLSAEEQFENSAWDNVNAMYRKDALMELPFRSTNFSEDWIWANEALHKGFALASDPSCVVYHYHHRSFKYAFKTDYIINYYFYKYFKCLPGIPNPGYLVVKAIYRILKKKDLSLPDKLYWIMHNLSSISAHTLSHITFLVAFKLKKEKGLERTYQLFCRQVPQGKLK